MKNGSRGDLIRTMLTGSTSYSCSNGLNSTCESSPRQPVKMPEEPGVGAPSPPIAHCYRQEGTERLALHLSPSVSQILWKISNVPVFFDPLPVSFTPHAAASKDRLLTRVALESMWPAGQAAAWPEQHQPIPADREELPDRRSKTVFWSRQSPEAGQPQSRKAVSAKLFPMRSATLPCVAHRVRCEFPTLAFVCLPSRRPCQRFPSSPALHLIRQAPREISWRRAKRTERCPSPCPTS